MVNSDDELTLARARTYVELLRSRPIAHIPIRQVRQMALCLPALIDRLDGLSQAAAPDDPPCDPWGIETPQEARVVRQAER